MLLNPPLSRVKNLSRAVAKQDDPPSDRDVAPNAILIHDSHNAPVPPTSRAQATVLVGREPEAKFLFPGLELKADNPQAFQMEQFSDKLPGNHSFLPYVGVLLTQKTG